MRIRIDGTTTEITYAISQLRQFVTIASVSDAIPAGQPYKWRVYVNTKPAPSIR